ncbi:MAG TPA: tetratricopeptide repeat protein [Gemmataceae bacterium]|nr:tetratricopeptide repeat protein [Gemmataceae bacterium]
MKRVRWLVALLGLGVAAAEAQAQGVVGRYGLYGPYGYGFSGVSIGGGFGRGRLRVGFGYSSGYFGGPFGLYGGPFGYYPSVSSVTIIQPVSPPPVVINNPPPVVVNQPLLVDPSNLAGVGRLQLDEPPPPLPPPVNRQRPLPGEPAGGFRPVRPEDRARARDPLPPAKPDQPKQEKPRPDQPKPPPRNPPVAPPRPPIPEPDPRAEHARQLAEGRRAFAEGEYGRAAFRFEQAVRAAPAEPFGHFLLAQALFSLGKYREAVAEIYAGMKLQPDWPRALYRPIELYGPNVADYPEDLQRLEDTLNRHRDDPVLLFLYGYFLWFDGRKEEARPYFERAAPLAPDRTDIDRFLQALPPPRIV